MAWLRRWDDRRRARALERFEEEMAEQMDTAITLGMSPEELLAFHREAAKRAPRIRRT